jgi:hypothetical protein
MRLHWATLMIIAAATALSARAEEPAQPGNAAVHYWCAAAVMNRPANEQEQKVLDYIEEWSFLPPKVFIERRDAFYFLQEDLKPGGTMDMLHVGAECSFCDFDTAALICQGWQQNDHLLRDLARRGWGAVTVLEGQGDLIRAAQLHADLLQFSAHLCQCPELTGALNGGAILTASLDKMGAFLSLKPGTEALRGLRDRFNRIPPNPMSFSRCWTYEARFQPPLLKKAVRLTDSDLDEALRSHDEKNDLVEWQASSVFGPEWKSVIQMLRSKKLEERQALVEGWAKQLGEELDAFAKAGDAPPTEAERRIRAQVEHMCRLAKAAEGNSAPENPTLAPWTGLIMGLYPTFVRHNASLEMGRILCAAALFEAESGQYPASLDALAKYFPAGVPKDPFTGQDFLYALEEGFPCVTAQPSASLRKELKPRQYTIRMAQMLKQQAERLERYRKGAQSPPSADH